MTQKELQTQEKSENDEKKSEEKVQKRDVFNKYVIVSSIVYLVFGLIFMGIFYSGGATMIGLLAMGAVLVGLAVLQITWVSFRKKMSKIEFVILAILNFPAFLILSVSIYD